ncbi:hypothetical protein [Pseudomonas putida]|uniref:hypothetical protein n=1 Tax=Pseudomonas putida TaxID=303 RepID=UPI000859493F|nr:hypothetical protein [Pseudomonas putida]
MGSSGTTFKVDDVHLNIYGHGYGNAPIVYLTGEGHDIRFSVFDHKLMQALCSAAQVLSLVRVIPDLNINVQANFDYLTGKLQWITIETPSPRKVRVEASSMSAASIDVFTIEDDSKEQDEPYFSVVAAHLKSEEGNNVVAELEKWPTGEIISYEVENTYLIEALHAGISMLAIYNAGVDNPGVLVSVNPGLNLITRVVVSSNISMLKGGFVRR